jgi:hypothetical protein
MRKHGIVLGWGCYCLCLRNLTSSSLELARTTMINGRKTENLYTLKVCTRKNIFTCGQGVGLGWAVTASGWVI